MQIKSCTRTVIIYLLLLLFIITIVHMVHIKWRK